MNIFYKEGDIYGCSSLGTSSVRGHHRPAHHDFGTFNVVRTGLLDDVGSRVGQGSNPPDICGVQLFGDSKQGEKR